LEWEADEFASELLMPSQAVQMLAHRMTISDFAARFKVSPGFAERRINLLRERDKKYKLLLEQEDPVSLRSPLKESFWANSQLGDYIVTELSRLDVVGAFDKLPRH
jgi:Zn-dependent peptidase ImmA (M78 family)